MVDKCEKEVAKQTKRAIQSFVETIGGNILAVDCLGANAVELLDAVEALTAQSAAGVEHTGGHERQPKHEFGGDAEQRLDASPQAGNGSSSILAIAPVVGCFECEAEPLGCRREMIELVEVRPNPICVFGTKFLARGGWTRQYAKMVVEQKPSEGWQLAVG